MATDDKDLSPEEAKIEKILGDASQSLTEIDTLINNAPSHSGPSYTPGPEYFTRWTPEKNEHYKKTLEYRKDAIKAETKEKTVKLLEKSPLDTQLRAYDRIDTWAEPEGDKAKNIVERTARKKDLDYSQDTAMQILSQEKKQSKGDKPEKEVEPDESKTKGETSPKMTSMSMRFRTTLSYNNQDDKASKEPERSDKGLNIDMDKK